MSKVSKRPAAVMPSVGEDKATTAAAKSDPDPQPLTPKQLQAMVPIRALRGRPKSENKKLLVSVRYSPEVVRDHHQIHRRQLAQAHRGRLKPLGAGQPRG